MTSQLPNASKSNIQAFCLKGHTEAVLCLDYYDYDVDAQEQYLLSGSEDGTARLWDLRTHKTCLCIRAGGDVTSVAFGRPTNTVTATDTEEPVSAFSKKFSVYLSAENQVLAFDLRKASSPILQPSDGTSILQADDEINQIGLSPPTTLTRSNKRHNSKAIHLAAADDAGVVQILNDVNVNSSSSSSKAPAVTQQQVVVLEHCKERISMVTSCAFRPGSNKTLELASGGTDCQVCLWDVNKPKKPSFSKIITAPASGNTNQLCNPPMVHSLAWSPSGRLLAAGLGDGTSSVFSLENRSLVEVARLEAGDDAGDSAVASVMFPSFLPSTTSTTNDNKKKSSHNSSKQKTVATAQDRLLATIRNDAVINLWDLGATVAGDHAINPSIALSRCNIGVDDDDNNGKNADNVAQVEDALNDLNLVADQPRLLFGIPHGKKPNWMVSSGIGGINRNNNGNNHEMAPSLYVADTSNDITCYRIPI